MTLGIPPFLIGCGSDPDSADGATPAPTPTAVPTPSARPRELRTLHFDFSYAELRELRLHAMNSASHRRLLVPHTDESRDRFRELNPFLGEVPDHRLTHFIEEVDLPSDALQLVWVNGAVAGSGERALATLHLHQPRGARLGQRQRVGAAGFRVGQSAKALAYRLSARGQALPDVDDYSTPFEAAVALVFATHELQNLNLDQGSAVIDLIERAPCSDDPSCQPFLSELAFAIASAWPATTIPGQGWATLTPILDSGGMPARDEYGEVVYQTIPSDAIAQIACGIAGRIRKLIFDDEQYNGFQWHPTEGLTAQDLSGSPSAGAIAVGGGAQAGGFAVVADDGPGTTAHGIRFDSVAVTDQSNRTVEVKFRNNYLRYISAYVQFANESGDLPPRGSGGLNTSRAEFLEWINSNYTILGIPLVGNGVPQSSVSFDVPSDASTARVLFGSLGMGGEAFSPEAVAGSALTLTFNIGLPTIFLVAGAVVTRSVQTSILQLLANSDTRGAIQLVITQAIELAGPQLASGIFGTANSSKATPILASLGNALVSAIFANGDLFAGVVAATVASISKQNIDGAVPVIGAAMKVLSVAADLAAIGESVGESLASPAIYSNRIRLTQSTTVTVDHDPNDFQFPSTAQAWEIVLTYDGSSMTRHASGTLEAGRTEPIVHTFDGVPSGGTVSVEVHLTSDSDCLVGTATLGPIDNSPASAGQIDIAITEVLIPLTQTTRYEQRLKLAYSPTAGRQWAESSAAPTATRADLCGGQDDRLCALNGITVSQRAGMAGYAYDAGGQGGQVRCDGTPAAILQKFQSVFLGRDLGPDNGAIDLDCGFASPLGVAYEKLGAADGSGSNFILQPTPSGSFVLPVTLTAGDPRTLNLSAITDAFGVFSQAVDSLALVSSGYLVGVNRQNHKLELLRLPSAAVDRNAAPEAVPYNVSKSGQGSRVGLLDSPVAVTAFRTTVLILEDGNKRIQALDVYGNPVQQFQNGTSSLVPLDTDATYLDIGVDGIGYLYVLSFVNDGLEAGDYRLDVITPEGNLLTRTTGVAAANIAVDTFRNIYTLNYEALADAPLIEPSLSQWEPNTPGGCPDS